MTLSLRFRSHDSKSTITCTWRDGQIVKDYNSRKSVWTMSTPPESVAAFESTCRQRFLLGSKWQCTALVGVAS
jgi:hypothetical protein